MALIDEIRTADEAMAAAINRKDPAAVAACYTPDAELLPPGAPGMKGRDAIRAFWAAAIEGGLADVALEPAEVEDFGETAVEAGLVKANAGSGKYLVLWKKRDGAWRIHKDCFNFDG